MGFIREYKKTVILSFIGIVILIFFGFYGQVQSLKDMPKDGESVTLKVKLESIELVYNDHVGNEWQVLPNVNGYDIREGQTIDVTTNKYTNVRLNVIVKENDIETDIGGSSRAINITDKDFSLSEKNIYPIDVYVKEDQGRYTENEALWRFTFIVKRKGFFF